LRRKWSSLEPLQLWPDLITTIVERWELGEHAIAEGIASLKKLSNPALWSLTVGPNGRYRVNPVEGTCGLAALQV
jgi:hypothetical protein